MGRWMVGKELLLSFRGGWTSPYKKVEQQYFRQQVRDLLAIFGGRLMSIFAG